MSERKTHFAIYGLSVACRSLFRKVVPSANAHNTDPDLTPHAVIETQTEGHIGLKLHKGPRVSLFHGSIAVKENHAYSVTLDTVELSQTGSDEWETVESEGSGSDSCNPPVIVLATLDSGQTVPQH